MLIITPTKITIVYGICNSNKERKQAKNERIVFTICFTLLVDCFSPRCCLNNLFNTGIDFDIVKADVLCCSFFFCWSLFSAVVFFFSFGVRFFQCLHSLICLALHGTAQLSNKVVQVQILWSNNIF